MLFSGTGSTGGSGIPAAAAPSSPAALSAVEILACALLAAVAGVSNALLLAIVTGAELPPTEMDAGLRVHVAEDE